MEELGIGQKIAVGMILLISGFLAWFTWWLSTEKKRTTAEWVEIHNIRYGIDIIDPDGWDRKNLYYSWHVEKITEQEFVNRLYSSTLMTLKGHLIDESGTEWVVFRIGDLELGKSKLPMELKESL